MDILRVSRQTLYQQRNIQFRSQNEKNIPFFTLFSRQKGL